MARKSPRRPAAKRIRRNDRPASGFLRREEAFRHQRRSVPGVHPDAREDLVVLRAAINHHREEGHCDKIVSVVLPEKAVNRERWCTRSEIARLIWSAWRYREVQKGQATDRRSRQHVARFILVAVYTGTRVGAVCAAALEPTGDTAGSTSNGASSIGGQKASGRRRSASRHSPAPAAPGASAAMARGGAGICRGMESGAGQGLRQGVPQCRRRSRAS